MLALFFVAQLAVARDSTYATQTLERLITRAAAENHAPPPSFGGYRAHVESELSLILRDTLGRENAAQIEQLALSAHWVRGGNYELHVIGYRSQGIGVPYSALTFVRGWTIPSLYGERLRLGVQSPQTRDTTARSGDTVTAVHPFAADRDRYYRYSGGDTVAVMRRSRADQRPITIVRIHASPRFSDTSRFAAFDGDIQLDAERGQIVRMRGRFVVRNAQRRGPLIARLPGVVGVAYCDFVNAEVDGKYWLPAFQRTEFQSSIALLGRSRALMRVVSEFSEHVIEGSRGLSDGDGRVAHITSWAPSDSVSGFGDWRDALGSATSSVSGADFDDIAPDAWRTTGAPHFDLFPTKTDNLLGFDRVGGFYTGVEGRLRMRDAFPGLIVGVRIGWAWSEKTLRGGANVSLQRGETTYALGAERTLPSTNDFLRPLEPDAGGVGAFLGSQDNFDYVDRRRALASFSQVFGSFDDAYLAIRGGIGRDQSEVARVGRGLRVSPLFLPNRHSATGSYVIASADLEMHPSVTGDFVRPGIGAHLHSEVGRGDLAWQRTEVAVSVRQYVGPVTLALHANGGIVTGDRFRHSNCSSSEGAERW